MKTTALRDEALLRRISLFAQLSDEKIEALARAAQRRRYERGSTILAAGEPAKGVHIVLAGRAKTVIEDGEGRAVTLDVIPTNEFFGSFDPDESDCRSGVKALDVCEILYVPRGSFLAAIEGSYAAAMLIARSMEARLCKAHLKIASLGLVDVYGRVARLLMDSARQVDGQWTVDTGSEEIARTVAASREMVSRVVKNMSAQGLVRKDKRKTVILDWHSMAAVCPS